MARKEKLGPASDFQEKKWNSQMVHKKMYWPINDKLEKIET